jgi:hypothetical protein
MNPFLQGRKNATMAGLTAARPASTGAQLPGMVRSAQARRPSPSVDVVKEGDKVVRLIVTCSCGEKTEIECLYAP